jgi:hypothetical protein
MAGTTRSLQFSEGVTVSSPSQSFLEASSLLAYANDAAYVSAKGSAAEEGDIYYNTTLDVQRLYSENLAQWISLGEGAGGIDNVTSIAVGDSPYTLLTATHTLLVDASGGAVTVNLYTAVGNEGRKVKIIKTDSSANDVTVDGSGAQTINGKLTATLNAQYETLQIQNNNANWYSLIQPVEHITSIAVGDSPYTALSTTDTLLVDASGGAVTVNLYSGTGQDGRKLKVIKTDSSTNAVTLDGSGGETIGGKTTTTLNTQREEIEIQTSSSTWKVLNRNCNTEWTAFTPTGAWTTFATYTGFWRRVNENIEIAYHMQMSGAADAATLTFNIPSFVTIDTAKLVGTSSTVGVGNGFDSGAYVYSFTGRYGHSGNTITVQETGSAGGNFGSVNATNPHTWSNNDWAQLLVSLPVVGWSAETE